MSGARNTVNSPNANSTSTTRGLNGNNTRDTEASHSHATSISSV